MELEYQKLGRWVFVAALNRGSDSVTKGISVKYNRRNHPHQSDTILGYRNIFLRRKTRSNLQLKCKRDTSSNDAKTQSHNVILLVRLRL